MAIDVWVTDTANAVRQITMEPGEPLLVRAGDRLEIQDVERDAVDLIRDGDGLVVRLETGFDYWFAEFVHLTEIDAGVAMAFAGGRIVDSLEELIALLRLEIIITHADGSSETVLIGTGETLAIQPGDTVSVSGVNQEQVQIVVAGDDVIILMFDEWGVTLSDLASALDSGSVLEIGDLAFREIGEILAAFSPAAGTGTGTLIQGGTFRADGDLASDEVVTTFVTQASGDDPDGSTPVVTDGDGGAVGSVEGVAPTEPEPIVSPPPPLIIIQPIIIEPEPVGVILVGGAGDDVLIGGAGDDTLIGGGGNDFLDGGPGIDTAGYLGFFTDFSFAQGSLIVTDNNPADGDEGTDTLVNIELLQFADQTVSADALPLSEPEPEPPPPSLATMSFDAGTAAPLLSGFSGSGRVINGTYIENSLAIVSLATGTFPHLHLGDNDGDGSGDLLLHSGPTFSTPYEFSMGGQTFDLISIEVVSNTSGGTWTAFVDGILQATFTIDPGTTGTVLFPEVFTNITSAQWEVSAAGDMTIDNLVFSGDPSTALAGMAGSDILVGTGADESLSGGADDDILVGKGGNDTLDGGGGVDLLEGGAGNDTYIFAIGDDVVEIRDSGGTADRVEIVTGISSLSDALRELSHFGFFFDESGSVLVVELGALTPLGLEHEHFLAIADPTGAGKIEEFTFDFLPGLVFNFGTSGTTGNDLIVLSASSADGLAGDDIIFGAEEAANTLTGGDGNDILVGADFADTLDGGDGNDVLAPEGGVGDSVLGGAGDDFFFGGDGVATLEGGADNDTYFFDTFNGDNTIIDTGGTDTIILDADWEFNLLFRDGNDLVLGSEGGATITVRDHYAGKPVETLVFEGLAAELFLGEQDPSFQISTGITGTGSNDLLLGTDAAETLTGGGGNDFIVGGGGIDSLEGGDGNDVLVGGSGNDTLDGGDGNDTAVYKGASADVIVNLSSAIQMGVESGTALHGGGGTDTLISIENVVGSLHDDTIIGSSGDNIIDGEDGEDTLLGGLGNDTYVWGEGEGLDTISDIGGASDVIVFETSPHDVLTPDILDVFRSGNDLEIRNAFAPTNEGMTIVNHFTTGTVEGFQFEDLGGAVLTFTGVATADNDFIVLDDSANTVNGGAGIDAIYGNDGADTLSGGNDGDFLIGGAGGDQLFGDAGDDVLVDGAFANSDTDTLEGGAGDDLLVSRGGNDILLGGLGDDVYEVEVSSNDAVTISDSGGTDRLEIGGDVELVGLEQIGSDLVFTFDTGATVTVVDHYAGQRVEIAFGHDDEFSINDDDDDEFFIINDDPSFTTNVPDLIAGTTGADTIDGLAGDDVIFGNEGNDTITGGLGADELIGGAGSDTFVYAEGDGGATVELADVITDFVDGSDLIGLSGGLGFGDLSIDQSADVVGDGAIDTVISVTATGEFLAVLEGIGSAITIDQNDVIVIV